MIRKEFYAFIFGVFLLAIGASAKSIIDVAVLKADNTTNRELILILINDVKTIKEHLIKRNR